MKAIAYKEFGGTDVLQTVEEASPAIIKADEVIVRVKAVSINPLDWKIRKGQMKLMSGSAFPKHTGTDFSGFIEKVGSSVTHLKKGDEVFGVVKNNMKDGALSEYVAVPSKLVWKKPATINFAQAASVPTVGFAAAMAIKKMGNLNSNSRILINGAAGGFGMLLLQLLKQNKAHVTAVVGTDAVNKAKEWGATTVIDYKKEDVLNKGIEYDVIIDLSGRMEYKKAKQIMKPISVFINPIPQPIDILTNPIKNIFRGKKQITLLSAPSQEYMNFIIKAIEEGLQIEVSKVFPFAQSQEAYAHAERGGVIGKIAIELN